MDSIFFLVMRRMRKPLLVLISIYFIVILGLVLIPGVDDEGNLWRMDFFHALYFVSFMATTIGFGEVPYTFTDTQRLWVLISIYATVISWIYSIGTLISLFQDPVFRQAREELVFSKTVNRMKEGFYLLCGYGETGAKLVQSLTLQGQSVVMIEKNESRASLLQLENLETYVPVLCANAAIPSNLLKAGLSHKNCKGVVALTDDNQVNLKIAITSKLLHEKIRVVCRADSHDVEANMASFGTDYIINPFDTFAWQLAIVFETPSLYILLQWLSGDTYDVLDDIYTRAPLGHWVICGYGRFGKAVYHRLKKEDIEPAVIEVLPQQTGAPDHCIQGRGTEAITLEEANIAGAKGLIAATDDDANNLSIIMTARELNPDLFVIVRQNLQENDALIKAIHANMVMNPSQIIANRVRVLLATPLLAEFFSLMLLESEAWACILVSRLTGMVNDELPDSWEVGMTEQEAPAVIHLLSMGKLVRLRHLICDSRVEQIDSPVIPLMIKRPGQRLVLPDREEVIKQGDQILFTSRVGCSCRVYQVIQNTKLLHYILTGELASSGWLWRKLKLLRNRH